MSRRRSVAASLATLALLAALAPPAAVAAGPQGASSRPKAAAKAKATGKAVAKAAPKKPEPRLPFVDGDYARALADARARNVPLVVDVWAPW